MSRTSFGFAEMLRSMMMVAAVFALFSAGVVVVRDGIATPAFATSEGATLDGVHKKSNGVGFVLMVSLQRAG